MFDFNLLLADIIKIKKFFGLVKMYSNCSNRFFISEESTFQNLVFSYGIFAEDVSKHSTIWKPIIKKELHSKGVKGNIDFPTTGPWRQQPGRVNRKES